MVTPHQAPIAVLIRSCLELLPAINGIAASGAVMVPLPVPIVAGKEYLNRLHHVIDDSGIRCAVVDDVFAEHFADVLQDIKTMIPSSLICGVHRGTLPRVDAEDLAIIQYASGSTSDPRGVALTH
jgi:fatty-acyl-CoA synthase